MKNKQQFHIAITKNENGIQLVDARILHAELEIKTKFTDWFNKLVADFGFVDGVDYTPISQISEIGIKPKKQYALTLNMAKEIAMIQRSEKGKLAREYFLKMEKIAIEQLKQNKSTIPTLTQAKMWLVESLEENTQLKDRIKKMVPDVEIGIGVTIGDNHAVSIDNQTSMIANDYGPEYKVAHQILFSFYRKLGVIRDDHLQTRPTDWAIKEGYAIMSDTKRAYITAKGREKFINQIILMIEEYNNIGAQSA
jgi:anti-repressor protein